MKFQIHYLDYHMIIIMIWKRSCTHRLDNTHKGKFEVKCNISSGYIYKRSKKEKPGDVR